MEGTMKKTIFNGGQRHTYQPGEPIVRYERVPFDIAEVITTEPPLEFHPKFADPDKIIFRDVTEFIPGVDSKMVDWWWANMEKATTSGLRANTTDLTGSYRHAKWDTKAPWKPPTNLIRIIRLQLPARALLYIRLPNVMSIAG